MLETVEEIENAIVLLPKNQLLKFQTWYDNFNADNWDKQIESDINKGSLDSLANSAIAEHLAGKSKKI